jgi:hypothetical protein
VETLTLKYRDHVISVEKKILSSFPPVMSTAVASSLSVLRECCLTCLAFGDGGPSVSCLHDMSSIAIVAYVEGDEVVRCQALWGFLNVM